MEEGVRVQEDTPPDGLEGEKLFRFLMHWCHKYKKYIPGKDPLDLLAVAYDGYETARGRWSREKCDILLPYATWWVKAKVVAEVKKLRRAGGIIGTKEDMEGRVGGYVDEEEAGEHDDGYMMSVDDRMKCCERETTENVMSRREDLEWMRKKVEGLPERLKYIIVERYWRERTLDSISKDMKLTKERVRQLERRALEIMGYSYKTREERVEEKVNATVEALRGSRTQREAARKLGLTASGLSSRMREHPEIGKALGIKVKFIDVRVKVEGKWWRGKARKVAGKMWEVEGEMEEEKR